MPSIRRKITFSYYAFAAIMVLLSAFAYLDLDYLEQRIRVDEIVSEFFDATLEMRRDEKNYFLYGETTNYLRAQQYASKAASKLREHRAVFLPYAGDAQLNELEHDLSRFQTLFQTYQQLPTTQTEKRDDLEQEIRSIGRNISLLASTMNQAERADLRETVGTARETLVISVVLLSLFGIGVGQVLSRRVVKPLRMLEDSMRPIAEGKFNKLDIPVKDREIVSFEQAFNRMLHEHDLHLQQLIQSEKLAALGTLVSGVAHELNNPLSNISSSCQILLEELDEADPAAQRELLSQIEEQTERARRTVLALLDFSRQGKFRKEPVLLVDLVRQTLKFLKGQIPVGVTVNVDIPGELKFGVDRRKLQQVVLNLVKNAVDAMGEDGRIDIQARVFAAHEKIDVGAVYIFGDKVCDQDGDMVILTVHDTGPGIPQAILSRIFEPFFTTRDVGRGSGLGLYIVQEIVQQHQGCIGVVSDAEHGTKFLIKLPYDNDASKRADGAAHE